MKDIQTLFDIMSAGWRAERSLTQITLGEMIGILSKMPQDMQMVNLENPHSYRGYYADLAFERGEGTRPVSEVLAFCEQVINTELSGYKGGEFLMDAITPVWISVYSFASGQRLMAIDVITGEIETALEEND